MSLSPTPHTLAKLEEFFRQIGWQIRYKKGNFQSGSCLLRNKKTIVINKFVPLEQKIFALSEILTQSPDLGIELSSKQNLMIENLKKGK